MLIPIKIQNIGWQLSGAFMNRGAFFISMLILAEKFNLQEYGKLGFALMLINSISGVIVPALGLNFRNEVVDLQEPIRNKYLAINFVLIFVFVSVLSLLIGSYFYFNLGSGYGLIYCILLYLNSLFLTYFNFLNYYFSGIDQFKKFNIKTIGIGLILLPLIYFIEFTSIFYALSIFLLVYIITYMILTWELKIIQSLRNLRLREIVFYLEERKNIHLPIFLQSVVNLPVLSIIQFMIILFTQNYYLIGLITFSTQIINLVSIVVNRINSVTIPALNKIKYKVRQFRIMVIKEISILLIISIIGSITIAFLLPFLIEDINPELMKNSNEIIIFILANVITYIYWFTQEVNIVLNENWYVFYANLVWAITVISVSFIMFILKYEYNLITYIILIIGSRFFIVSFLISKIFGSKILKHDKVYI